MKNINFGIKRAGWPFWVEISFGIILLQVSMYNYGVSACILCSLPGMLVRGGLSDAPVFCF